MVRPRRRGSARGATVVAAAAVPSATAAAAVVAALAVAAVPVSRAPAVAVTAARGAVVSTAPIAVAPVAGHAARAGEVGLPLVVPLRHVHPHHVVGLQPLRLLQDLELHALALVQRLEAVPGDAAVMDEHVGPVFTLDEAEPFLGREPLHGPCGAFHVANPGLTGVGRGRETARQGRRSGMIRSRFRSIPGAQKAIPGPTIGPGTSRTYGGRTGVSASGSGWTKKGIIPPRAAPAALGWRT